MTQRIVRVARKLASYNVLDAVLFPQKKACSLGLLGYSFGAVVASNAVARASIDGFVAMSTLRIVNGLEANLNFGYVKLLIHGRRDNVAPY